MMTAQTERRNRQHVNSELHRLGTKYHDSLPIQDINDILDAYDFRETEPAIYCGRDGHSHEQVGDKTWLSLSWHKMEQTGRYEVVAYVS
jgi:hypothetical protein